MRVTIGTVEREYRFGITKAPECYDGFGTFTVMSSGEKRLVAIDLVHADWQLNRYGSGNFYLEEWPGGTADIERKLWERILSPCC